MSTAPETESRAQYKKIFAGLVEHYRPATEHERNLVEAHAEDACRLLRVRAQETAFLDAAVTEMRKADPELSHDRAIARLFMDRAHMSKMRLFIRYMTAVENAYYKSLAELESAIADRAARERVAAFVSARPKPVPAPVRQSRNLSPQEPYSTLCATSAMPSASSS